MKTKQRYFKEYLLEHKYNVYDDFEVVEINNCGSFILIKEKSLTCKRVAPHQIDTLTFIIWMVNKIEGKIE